MVDIYDGLFNRHLIKIWYKFIVGSYFKTDGWDDFKRNPFQTQIFSLWGEEDWDRFGMGNTEEFKQISEKYSLHKMSKRQTRINLLTSAERTSLHTDEIGVTLLYYSNPEWDISWGGHTLFMDKKCNHVEKTVLFKPGRLVIFDGTYPHMIIPPTISAPGGRYTLAIQYMKN